MLLPELLFMFCPFTEFIMKRNSKKRLRMHLCLCVCVCVYWGYHQVKDAAAGKTAKWHFKTPLSPPFWHTHTHTHKHTHPLGSDWTRQVISSAWQALALTGTARAHKLTHTTNTCQFCGKLDRRCSFFNRRHVRSYTGTHIHTHNTVLTRLNLPYKKINKYLVWIHQWNFKIIANRMKTIKSLKLCYCLCLDLCYLEQLKFMLHNIRNQ